MENEIFWCKNCLNTSTRPRINFNKLGNCNACVWSEEKKSLNWNKRQEELLDLIDQNNIRNETIYIGQNISIRVKE